jgi:hypothetical protein
MLELQVSLLQAWYSAGAIVRHRVSARDERGEVTATTALIVLLVVAAIAAGTVIATRITDNANNVPSP